MNAKQSLRAASKRILELEDYNRRCSADIKAYNQCIDSMIAGGSPCDWCEDNPECQRQVKGKGCSEWWLAEPERRVGYAQEADNADADPGPVSGVMPE